VTLSGVSALEWILATVPAHVDIVVVAPERATSRPVRFCLEEPRFGGPVAALAAALDLVRTPVIALLGADMPLAGQLSIRLVDEFGASDRRTLLPVDADGRQQPLAMVAGADELRAAVAALRSVEGRSMRELLGQLECSERPLSALESRWLRDFDTPADLEALRTMAAVASEPDANGEQMSLDRWVEELRAELGIEDEIDIDAILDLARVAAHGVQRPAAPLTAYMLGLAVARGADFRLATQAIELSASTWVKPDDEDLK